MCTRYYVELSPELRPIIEEAKRSALADRMIHSLGRPLKTEGEIRPTDIAAVIATSPRGSRSVYPMIWGFVLPGKESVKRSGPLVNARMESADRKPTFRESWSRRRCIVPASWYFEWDHMPGDPYEEGGKKLPASGRRAGHKYAIQPKGEKVTWLAGLYRIEGPFPHFTVLTRQPEGAVSAIHDRMPVILETSQIAEWINPMTDPARVKEMAWGSLTDMSLEKQDKDS